VNPEQSDSGPADVERKARVLRHMLAVLRNLRDKKLNKTGKDLAAPPEPKARTQRPRRPGPKGRGGGRVL